MKQDGDITANAFQAANNSLQIINNISTNGGINLMTGTTNNSGQTDPSLGATSRVFIKSNCKPDVIITDPPREGMHKKVISQIMNVKPEKIVYISCNSATQARDIAILKELYDIEFIQPVDMFPMTHHVENIVSLILKKKIV